MAYKKLKYYFDKELLELLSSKLKVSEIQFDSEAFILDTHPLLETLELKDRIRTVATQLHQFLPGSYSAQVRMLVEILGPENPGTYGTFNDYFWTWPIATFIELFGLGQEAISLRALEEVTKRGTGEFAVRPYIRQNPTGLLKIMTAWSQDDNFHLRRLSSEGLRPLLPWSQKLTLFIDDPTPLRAILEHLKNDPSRYVQKSVANHINDYLKVNHDFGRSIIDEWSDQPGINTRWIIKHAIRNYRKKEEAWAIALTARMNN